MTYRLSSSIFRSSLGNVLECYDFQLFATFSPLLSQIFFPTTHPIAGTLQILMIFAIGFLCRPIGALLLGYHGDGKGRAHALRLSILLISASTILIGLLPTWSQAGIWSPLSLVALRIIQGISLGGEYSGNLIYLAETAPQHHKAFFLSFACIGANLGILLGLGVGTLCLSYFPENILTTWGWRVPWLLSGILSLLIMVTRFNLQETPPFNAIKDKKLLIHNPIRATIASPQNINRMLHTIGLIAYGSALYYFIYAWLPNFLNHQLHISTTFISVTLTLCLLGSMLLLPLAGWICDRVPRKKMLLINPLIGIVFILPIFYLLCKGYLSVLIALPFLILISCFEQAATANAVVYNFPTHTRYTGFSFSFNLANGLIGGTTPLICSWLIQVKTYHLFTPAFYIAFCGFLTIISVCVSPKKSLAMPHVQPTQPNQIKLTA